MSGTPLLNVADSDGQSSDDEDILRASASDEGTLVEIKKQVSKLKKRLNITRSSTDFMAHSGLKAKDKLKLVDYRNELRQKLFMKQMSDARNHSNVQQQPNQQNDPQPNQQLNVQPNQQPNAHQQLNVQPNQQPNAQQQPNQQNDPQPNQQLNVQPNQQPNAQQQPNQQNDPQPNQQQQRCCPCNRKQHEESEEDDENDFDITDENFLEILRQERTKTKKTARRLLKERRRARFWFIASQVFVAFISLTTSAIISLTQDGSGNETRTANTPPPFVSASAVTRLNWTIFGLGLASSLITLTVNAVGCRAEVQQLNNLARQTCAKYERLGHLRRQWRVVGSSELRSRIKYEISADTSGEYDTDVAEFLLS